ncbi:hypothetical protein [Methylobacterium nodulans]|uniref:hypothetical protein n=1 Tax=Methylobacterium nodulans TaxID=114616 RepID=UPI0012ED2AAE|nr:hypothetical protein [Methylobacterium nodulans]
MQRERKTWAQIATLVWEEIQCLPDGEKLLSIEFETALESEDCPGFTIETKGMSKRDNQALARAIAGLVSELRRQYDVRDYTLH